MESEKKEKYQQNREIEGLPHHFKIWAEPFQARKFWTRTIIHVRSDIQLTSCFLMIELAQHNR